MTDALVIAAPSSHQGKTLVTTALIGAWRSKGRKVGSCKLGPDYIDKGFHHRAGARPCINMDLWAMRPHTLMRLHALFHETSHVAIESAMGLFDEGAGFSAFDAASQWHLPIVLVVDGSKMAQSAAALLYGFTQFKTPHPIKGVLFNKVGSAYHEQIMRSACQNVGITCVGCLPYEPSLHIASRHLGLHQSFELREGFFEQAAQWLMAHADMEHIDNIMTSWRMPALRDGAKEFMPKIRHLAVAQDEAFSFHYEWLETLWRESAVCISYFSPLKGEMADDSCDAIFLAGGYPEHHLASLGDAFFAGLRHHAEKGTLIYGECGGFMVLGRWIIDKEGKKHKMADLLPLACSFEDASLTLGYRRARALSETPFLSKGEVMRGHEFHYCKAQKLKGESQPFLHVTTPQGQDFRAGMRCGSVMGSFIHMIDGE